MANKNKNNTKSNAFDAFGGGSNFGLTKRVDWQLEIFLIFLETEEVFDRALLEKKMNLTVKTTSKNTSTRATLSPNVSIRSKPFVVKPDAAMDKAFAELRKKYPHMPNLAQSF